MTKKIHIEYYALLRDERGAPAESLATTAATPRDLYRELQARHHFSLPPERLKVALNDEFQNWNAELRDGDRLVFIPPVAGG